MSDEPLFPVGRLGRPHGLKGYLGLYVDDSELVYFEPGSMVVVDGEPHRVRDIRKADRGYRVAFEEITDRSGAEAIRNLDVLVASRRELAEGEYWPEDLIGLEVRPGGGSVVGVVSGAVQDRLVVERDDYRFEVPFVEALVPVVDLDTGFVELVEIEGLNEPPGR